VYSDVWGPAHHATIDNKFYYITFTDDYLRESIVYLMKNKSKAFHKYKNYEAIMKWQRNIDIKSFITDGGGEYTSNKFEEYLRDQGTLHKITVHDTPESNGIAERLNRTLVEKTHPMLFESKLPNFLWGYAILHMTYLKNRTYMKSLPDKTPYKMGHHSKPNLNNSFEWGTEVYVKIKQTDKLELQAKSAQWVRHANQSNGHYIYWPDARKVSIE
jgi:transposase InsO family protein